MRTLSIPRPPEARPPDAAATDAAETHRRRLDIPGRGAHRSHVIQKHQIRVNHRIRAREVRVIVAGSNEQLGIMRIGDALRKAESMGLDLVEVAPTAEPPVCRIVDFGKYCYQIAKQERDRKHTTSKLKEVKFRVNIDEHDYSTKIRHAEEFLDRGNKVRVHLQFRGREMAHKELGNELMERVRNDLVTMGQVESEPRLAGRNISMTVAPLPASKRKRRFSAVAEPVDEAGSGDAD